MYLNYVTYVVMDNPVYQYSDFWMSELSLLTYYPEARQLRTWTDLNFLFFYSNPIMLQKL